MDTTSTSHTPGAQNQARTGQPRATSAARAPTASASRAQAEELLQIVGAKAKKLAEQALLSLKSDDLVRSTVIGAGAIIVVNLLSSRSLAIMGFSAGAGFAVANWALRQGTSATTTHAQGVMK